MKIAIVGAGITGSFLAYLLTQSEGSHDDVDLWIGDQSAPKASDNNPGTLAPLNGPGIPGPMLEFSMASYALHLKHKTQIKALTGIDFFVDHRPRIMLASTNAEKQLILSSLERYVQMPGFSAKWLDSQQLQSLEPRISDQLVGGMLCHGIITLNAREYTRAVALSAQIQGATLINEQVVKASSISNQTHLIGHKHTSREYDFVFWATGPWSELWWQHKPALVKPLKGELLLMRHKGLPFAFDLTQGPIGPAGLYWDSGQQYWLGGTAQDLGFNTHITESSRQQIFSNLKVFLPDLSQFEWVKQSVGLRPVTPDSLPIISYLPGSSQQIVVTGAGAKGMLWSAAMAELAIDLMTSPTKEISAFSIARFETPIDFQAVYPT